MSVSGKILNRRDNSGIDRSRPRRAEVRHEQDRRIKRQLTAIAAIYAIALPSVVYLSSTNSQLFVWLLYALLALFSLVYLVSRHQTT